MVLRGHWIIAWAVSVLLLTVWATAAEPVELRVGSELDFRPYCFTDADNQPTGFGVELLGAVAEKMGLKVRVTPGPWATVWNQLLTGEVDVLPVVARTAGRESLVDFSLPHTTTLDAFFVRTGAPAIASLTAAAGKQIVVLREDAAHHQLVERGFTGQIIPVESIVDGLRLVASGKHDAFLCSKLIGTLEQQQAGIRGIVSGPPIPDYQRVFSFAVRKGNRELLDKLNEGLLQVKADGTYERIYERWLDVEEAGRNWVPYLQWAIAGLAGLVALAILQQWLVYRRTRQLRALTATLEQRVQARTMDLSVSEQRLKLAACAGRTMVYDVDVKTLRINEILGLSDLLGHEPNQSEPALAWWDRQIHPDDLPGCRAALERTRAQPREQILHYRVRHKDGRLLWVEDRATPLCDEHGSIVRVIGTVRDITARKQAEEQLRSHAQTFHGLVENNPMGIYVVDADFKMHSASQGARRIWADLPGELIGRDFNECLRLIWPEPFASEALGRFRHTLDTGEPYVATTTVRRRDRGELEAYDWRIERITLPDGRFGVVCYFYDLSERQRLEAALKDSQHRLQLALQSGRMLAWEYDPASELMHLSNSSTLVLPLSKDQTRVPIKDIHALIHPDDVAQHRAKVERTIRDGGSYQSTYRQVRDEQVLWFEENAQAITDASGKALRLVGVTQNITERKTAEQAVRTSELRFNALHESLRDAFVQVDMDGRIQAANDLFCQMLGYTAQEVGQLTYLELTPERWHEFEARIVREEVLARGYSKVYEKEYRRKDGSIFPVELRTILVRDDAGRPMAMWALVRDITDRKAAEEAVRASEQRLRSFVEASSQVIWTVDANAEVDMAIPSWQAFTGQSYQEAKGRGWMNAIHSEDRQRVADAWQKAIETRGLYEVEYRLRIHDGTWRNVLARGVPIKNPDGTVKEFIGTCIDITRSKQTEHALRDSETRIQQALSVSRSYTFEWIPATDVVQRSTSCSSILRLSGDEAVRDTGRNYFQRVHPEDRQPFIDLLAKLTPTSPSYSVEYRVVCGDGHVVMLEETAQASFDAAGKAERLVGVATDITRRKHAENALLELNATLERRVAERTTEVQQKADQLRMLALELTRTEERERRRLAQILHDDLQQTLVAAKLRLSGVPGPVAREVQGLLDESIRTSRSLTADLSPPVLYDGGLVAGLRWLAGRMQEKHGLIIDVQADAQDEPQDQELQIFLYQAVREMLFNVVKHAGVNQARVSLRRHDSQVTVQVQDPGRGFNTATAHQTTSSSGFGILSLRERVKLMGGRLDITSAPGKGTCVTLEVDEHRTTLAPTGNVAAPARATQDEEPLAPHRSKGEIRVLLADDHKVLREGLAQLLQGEQDLHVVGQASDGLEAVELAGRLRPDVVIMDISMPRMDGIDATRAITTQNPAIRVIGLSMHEAGAMEAKMRSAGAVAYLRKDGPSNALVAAIRQQALQPR